MAKRNVYMGMNSVAGIETNGKVDEDWEILLNLYATAYDSLNDIMLTHDPGEYDPTTAQEIRGRFLVLRRLARKYAPHIYKEIEEIEKLTLMHYKKQITDKEFLKRLRKILIKHGIPLDLIKEVEMKIDIAENLGVVQNPFEQKPTTKSKSKANGGFDIVMPNLEFDLFSTPKPKSTKKKVKSKPLFDFKFPDFDLNFNFDFFNPPKTNKRKKR